MIHWETDLTFFGGRVVGVDDDTITIRRSPNWSPHPPRMGSEVEIYVKDRSPYWSLVDE